MNSEFKGMTNKESLDYQLQEWVKGRTLHNTVRDECCPDFSCCCDEIMPVELRMKFAKSVKEKDEKTQMAILGMALSGNFAKDGIIVHTAGEDPTVH